MEEANKRQVGGLHYKSDYEHWDFVIKHNTHYLVACASKYITRHKENREVDLQKAIHYLEKMIESGPDPIIKDYDEEDVHDFSTANELTVLEHDAILTMTFARTKDDYLIAIDMIKEMIEELPSAEYLGADHD